MPGLACSGQPGRPQTAQGRVIPWSLSFFFQPAQCCADLLCRRPGSHKTGASVSVSAQWLSEDWPALDQHICPCQNGGRSTRWYFWRCLISGQWSSAPGGHFHKVGTHTEAVYALCVLIASLPLWQKALVQSAVSEFVCAVCV